LLIRAALIPMNRYRILQTIGKTIEGGESGGCLAKVLNNFEPSLVSQADNPPADSAKRIQRMYDFHGSFFISDHPVIDYVFVSGNIQGKQHRRIGAALRCQIKSAISRTSRCVSFHPIQGSVMDFP